MMRKPKVVILGTGGTIAGKAGSNTDTVNKYKELRFYAGATLTIAGKAGQSIKSVVFNTAFADKTASCAPSAAGAPGEAP